MDRWIMSGMKLKGRYTVKILSEMGKRVDLLTVVIFRLNVPASSLRRYVG